MPIHDKSYFKPMTYRDIRKYYSISMKYTVKTDAGTIVTLNTKYYHYFSGLTPRLPINSVPESAFRDISVNDLNEVHLEYAVGQFLKLFKTYKVSLNPEKEKQLIAKIIHVANAVIDLRNWFLDREGIPDCYFESDEYFNGIQEPDISSMDELLAVEGKGPAPTSTSQFHWLDINDLKWENIILEFTSNDTLRIETLGEVREYNFTQLGFHRKRNPLKKIQTWKLLELFAAENGILAPIDIRRVEKPISNLRSILKQIFGIKSDPIIRKKKLGIYETLFVLRPNKNLQSDFSNYSEEEY